MKAIRTFLIIAAFGTSPLLQALAAQEPTPVAAAQRAAATGRVEDEKVDIITPHITDSYELDVPTFSPPFYRGVCIGRHDVRGECTLPRWESVGKIGSLDFNLSPTKHVVMLLIASALAAIVLIGAAMSHKRHTDETGSPKGFAAGIEAVVLYIRNEVILPNVGPHGDGFVPYLLTIFFFILFANLLGLIPFGSTATGNIAVTAALALMTLVVIEISGIRSQGLGYLNTLFYWNKDLSLAIRIPMFAIMSVIEMIGKLSKPFALAIRLFANMTAGHIVVLAFIGLIFAFKSLASGAPFIMAVGIMMLELFTAFLQAFIFTLLSSVFIGQIREAAH